MNIARFLEHWQLTENPFRAEEARHDGVLARMKTHIAAHPDFEKILGDVGRPSTSIVFGEKGSGKTAIRLHLADCVAAHNREHPDDRVLFVPYDDLNPFLDALHEHHVSHGRSGKGGGGASEGGEDREILKSLEKTELVDHMDAILALAVDQVVTGVVSHDASTDTDAPSAIDHDSSRRSPPHGPRPDELEEGQVGARVVSRVDPPGRRDHSLCGAREGASHGDRVAHLLPGDVARLGRDRAEAFHHR